MLERGALLAEAPLSDPFRKTWIQAVMNRWKCALIRAATSTRGERIAPRSGM